MDRVCLGKIDDIAEGQSKGFDPKGSGNDSLFVVRKGAQLYAYLDICPHYGSTSLPWKRHQYLDGTSNYIVCSAHGALFDIESGRCIRGACVGQSLKKIEVEVLFNNEIWVDLTTIEEFKS
jgi:nitrite reductase/ring-hydroxylating ferredoxin subunit